MKPIGTQHELRLIHLEDDSQSNSRQGHTLHLFYQYCN